MLGVTLCPSLTSLLLCPRTSWRLEPEAPQPQLPLPRWIVMGIILTRELASARAGAANAPRRDPGAGHPTASCAQSKRLSLLPAQKLSPVSPFIQRTSLINLVPCWARCPWSHEGTAPSRRCDMVTRCTSWKASFLWHPERLPAAAGQSLDKNEAVVLKGLLWSPWERTRHK